MKKNKWLLPLMSILLVFFLVACKPAETLDVDALLTKAEQQVELLDKVNSDITLPTTVVIDGLTIDVTWSSNNPNVISALGVVTRPTQATGDVSVTLTATFTYREKEKIGNFTVVVESLPELTVSFNTNGGSMIPPITVGQGETIGAPLAPTKANHEFVGWYKDTNLTNLWNFSSDVISSSLSLYAKWQENEKYAVTFQKNNGDTDVVIQVYADQKINPISAPVKSGYTFSYWAKNDSTKWNFILDIINKDMTLHAVYELMTFQITYVLPEQAQLLGNPKTTFDITTAITDLGSATLSNHQFLGWFTAATGGTKVTSIALGTTGNQMLYAQFQEDAKYTVIFDSNGGSIVGPINNLYAGSFINAPTEPTRVGYRFVAWYKDSALADDYVFTIDKVLGSTTLYAKWELSTYTITYHLNGGESNNPPTYTVETPTFSLSQATKAGFTFINWTDQEVSGDVVTEVALGRTGNLNFYAQYNPVTYQINYMLNGGTVAIANPTTYQSNSETIVLNQAFKEGYAFVGWFDDESEGDLYTTIETGSIGNITLYARFDMLVTLNFYDEQPANIISVQSNDTYFQTTFALTDQHQLFAKGDNHLGLLANGTYDDSNQWLNITSYFGLREAEVILSVQLTESMAVAHTSNGRLFIWGFYNVDESIEVYSNQPLDITSQFNFSTGALKDYYNYGTFFVVETIDERILIYDNMTVHDATPILGEGESFQWSPLYGFNDTPYPTAIYTGLRILMLNPFDLTALIDLTVDLNLPVDEDVLVVLSQDFSVHVMTETTYNYATVTGDELAPIMAINIDLELTFNPLEGILMHYGGGFITTENRLLLPLYIVNDLEDEMPVAVKYFDVTNQLGLAVGETIVETFHPFFIKTSLGRVLIVQFEEDFSTNPLNPPTLEVTDVEIAEVLDPNEVLIEILFSGREMYILTNQKLQKLIFGPQNLEVEPIIIGVVGLVHTGIYPVSDLRNLFVPQDRMYEDFTMWYIDPQLQIQLSAQNVVDGMNLYAGFERTHYFVEFNDYHVDIPKMAVEIGKIPVAPPVPIVEHQTFVGWFYLDQVNNHQAYDFSYAVDADLVLYANYSLNTYQVTFIFETEEPLIAQEYAYTYYGDLTILVPEGYEVVAVYLDQEMLIAFDPNQQLLEDVTLFIAIDQMTIDLYYFYNSEYVTFENVFSTDIANYGFTADGKIYAWGSNNSGGLGIGFDSIYDLNTPLDITAQFNLEMGEEISQTYALYAYKLFITNLGRVFAWGYPDQDNNYYGTPQDLTSMFALEIGETVMDVHIFYDSFYVFTNQGNVYIYNHEEDVSYHFTTTLNFVDVMYLDRVNNDMKHMVIVIPSGVYELQSTVSGDAAVENKINVTFTDEIFKVLQDFTAYNVFYIYTKEGRVYSYNHTAMSLVELFDLALDEFDELTQVIEYSWDYILYLTNSGRLYEHEDNVTSEYDLSDLGAGEVLMYLNYTTDFYTSLGNSAYLDTNNHKIFSVNPAFELGSEGVVYYQRIDFMVYAYTTAGKFIGSYGFEGELMKKVGVDLVIEQYVFGELFELPVPESREGFEFGGWLDDYQQVYEGVPTNVVMLYADWYSVVLD